MVGEQGVYVASDGRRVILHVRQALRDGRGPGTVGQTHPQVQHDLETGNKVRKKKKK